MVVAPGLRRPPSPVERRHGRGPGRRRLAALGVLAGAAFLLGVVAGARDEPAGAALAREYGAALARGDYAAMHRRLSPAARAEFPLGEFARAHDELARLATARRIVPGAPRERRGGAQELPVTVHTRAFGLVRARLRLPLQEGPEAPTVAWRPHLAFPGLRPGEALARATRLPPRATLEARDGTALAQGEARLSELGAIAAEVAGRLGPAPPERAAALAARGVPPTAPVGLTGLEREFDERLAGTPGGELRAGKRILARRASLPAPPVRTTIDPALQRAAVDALAGRYGGIAALRPATGEVLALAGIAALAPQPPGSTFKIVTLAGALEAGVVARDERFPVQTTTTLSGVTLENANGESCGGTLRASFAESCNTVFAPLGVRLGPARLVASAERFGFNEPPALRTVAPSTLPAAGQIGDDLAVGSTAIGQGKVLATAVHMASVAATIAYEGVRVRPTLRRGRPGAASRAVSPATARTVARGMRAVVTSGTGVAAALPDAGVAGKTGTAELRSTVSQDPEPDDPGAPRPDDPTDTDAWFAGYAPLREPRVAVAVLLVGQGAGGTTAAPAARAVLAAALRRRGR